MPDDGRPVEGVPLPPGYTLVEKLGSGGFATVWLAEQGGLGRRVAVKLVGETLEGDERERRFVAECRAVGRLSGHPSVVTVHDAGTTAEGNPYLVMEHLPGGSLQDRLRDEGPLPWQEVLMVGVHVADALSAAHDTGILHRDVKPANVLLDETGAPKLADFGIARLAEGTATATGHVLGTILYTPPEVLSGERPAPTADVWALGALLHTLLAGRSAFQGEEAEPPAVLIARVLRGEPPDLPAQVPPALRDMVGRLLAADPADRPQSAAEVARSLQAIQAAQGLAVTPARATREVVDHAQAGGDATRVGFAPISADLTAPGSPAPPPPGPGTAPPTPPGGPVPPPVVGTPSPAGPPPPPPPPSTGWRPPDGAEAPAPPPAAAPLQAAASPQAGDVTRAVGATVATPAASPPGGPAGAPPPGPPPAPGGRRRGLPLLLGAAAILVVVALVVLVVVATGGDSDGDADEATGGTGPAGSAPATASVPGADEVDTIWGVRSPAPTGTAEQPAPVEAATRAVDCGGTLTCAATEVDGDAVVAYPDEQGSLLVERLAAGDGSSEWTEPVPTPASNVALAPAGDVVLVVTTEDAPDGSGPQRTYNALDPGTGGLVWGPRSFPQDQRVVRALDQSSIEVSVLVASGEAGPEVLGLSNTDGEVLWTAPGQVLATDARTAYVADGGAVAALELSSGDETWRRDLAVAADGASPVTRLGVAADDVLVTVTDDQVVGLATADGSDAWPGQPLSTTDAEVGAPVAVSAAGGRAVVAAEAGDLGIDPVSGEVAWRTARDPLLAEGEANVWVGTADRLVVGQLGAPVRVIATDQGGEELAAIDSSPASPSLSSFAFQGGIALLGEDGITASSTDDLSPLWNVEDVAGAVTLVAVDGGVVVLGPDGVQLLTAG
ncbi:serine/threonine-protein kinase [Iamia majanohamensis]|uniref:non-specific serine/threonine protein kinase n=1 Tax=Iamia majanohamensis TaxID=467976 RepID=A0AAE9YIH9_9ACTN|nr:serine/threonine-protein kinase [Iamia majanohamensis]WCO69182.1 serine/threonine-protein kinase [Iamia majanohamensis]